MLWGAAGLVILSLILLAVRLYYVIPGTTPSPPHRARQGAIKSLIVLGSGGHTAEMFRLLRGLDPHRYTPRIYVTASTDHLSANHCERFESQWEQEGRSWKVETIPRARQVGQSYLTSIFTTLRAFCGCCLMVWKAQPDVILCNGPGTCVPICVASYIPRILGLHRAELVYVESICRVKRLSLSARMLYLLVDKLYVQWEGLAQGYPKAQYMGLLSH